MKLIFVLMKNYLFINVIRLTSMVFLSNCAFVPPEDPPEDPVADFQFADSSYYAPCRVKFVNWSKGKNGGNLSGTWDFGNGQKLEWTENSNDTIISPMVMFDTAGVYTIKLSVLEDNINFQDISNAIAENSISKIIKILEP